MVQQFEFTLTPFPRGFHLVTEKILEKTGMLPESGIFNVFIKHTSAGLTINENADPTVRKDFRTTFDRLVPESNSSYLHNYEGPDDMPAHIKTSIVGSSLSIPISNHKLNLGVWQGIYLCEFRNDGGQRSFVVTVIS